MVEIDALHTDSPEWRSLMTVANWIAEVEGRIGPWDDLTNMVVSLLENHRTSDPQSLTTLVYPFFLRLYFRIKQFDKPMLFNKVSRAFRLVPISVDSQYQENVPGFLITNYDFNTYKWAISLKQDDFINNNSLWIPISSLTPAQIKRLDKKVKDD